MSGNRITGKVKFFSDSKGYGFIAPDGGGKDIFVHRNDLPEGLDHLDDQQKVSFIPVESNRQGRGVKATQVAVL